MNKAWKGGKKRDGQKLDANGELFHASRVSMVKQLEGNGRKEC